MMNSIRTKIKTFKNRKNTAYHGGAWKVAYADFVTAMMAFFLLMWLLNVSTKEELDQLAGWFQDPTYPTVSSSESGAAGILGGRTVAEEGARTSEQVPLNYQPTNAAPTGKTDPSQLKDEELAAEAKKREEKRFEEVKEQIQIAINSDPKLKALSKHLVIDETPEGLRIQIIDQDGQPMFARGSKVMLPRSKELHKVVAAIIKPLPNEISIKGHTDAKPFPGNTYTNWELSADRANSSRKVLLEYGYPTERVQNVVGKAATDLYNKEDPLDPQNRRIGIILIREEITAARKGITAGNAAPVAPYSRTQGSVPLY